MFSKLRNNLLIESKTCIIKHRYIQIKEAINIYYILTGLSKWSIDPRLERM